MTGDIVRAHAPETGFSPAAGGTKHPYIQYGCGACAPAGWLNFDASPRLRIERLVGARWLLGLTLGIVFPVNARPGDIVAGLPVSDESAAAVFCSHVLEHLPRDDVVSALRNTFRILRPGGIFRLVVPDLRWRADRYLSSAAVGEPLAADAYMDACLLGRRARPSGLMAWMSSDFGNSLHLWMYDFAALKMILGQVGFEAVRRCELGDCGDPMFALVEYRDRFFDSGQRELAIEALKPGLLPGVETR